MRRIWPFLALAVAGGVVFLVARGMKSAERRADPAAPRSTPAKTTADEASPEVAPLPIEEATAPGPEPLQGDWTITGRVVTERAAGSEEQSSALEPVRESVAGAAVRVRLAPPEDGEESPPPRAPREVVTGPDGRFSAASLPGKTPLEVEVDAPGNALEIVSLELDSGVEGAERRRDIGEVILGPACTLVVRLLDPEGMPVEAGKVIIDRWDLWAEDQPREAVERDGGEYVAERLPPGEYSVEAWASGWAPSGDYTELPREEPLEVRLEKGGFLKGIVRASTGEPIAGAKVTTRGDDVTFPVECDTDASGRFELRGFSAGLYEIGATAEGFHRAIWSVEDDDEVEIWLQREAIMEGKVLDEEDGRPIADVFIHLDPIRNGSAVDRLSRHGIRNPSASRYRFSTDARGRFVLDGLQPFDEYGLLARDEHRGLSTITGIAVGPGAQVTGLDIRYSAGGMVRGRVLDPAGRGLEGSSVGLTPEDKESAGKGERRRERTIPSYLLEPPGRSARTSADGTYEIENVMPGLYSLSAAAPGWASQPRGSIRISDGLVVEGMDFVFAGGTSVAGRVLYGTGGGVVEASIDVQVGSQKGWAMTDAEGRFVIRGLAPGRATIHADKEGLGRASARILLPSDDVLLVLGTRGTITGRVEAPGRSVLPRGTISIWTFREGRNPVESAVSTDEAGRFSASVEPGPSILVIAEIHPFGKSEVETSVEPGELREVVIPIRPGGTIEGIVVSRITGEPVEDAELRLESGGGRTTFHDAAGEKGEFEIDDVPEGAAVLLARHPNHRTARQEVHVVAGETTIVRIEVEGGQGIHGRVLRHGRPLVGARVVVGDAGAVSGSGGLYEILGLAPGEYDISVQAAGPGGRPLLVPRRVTIQDGRLTERDLDLGAMVVTGRVLRNGTPMAGIEVAASMPGEDLGSSTTDTGGDYSLDLPGGREVDLSILIEGKTLAVVDLLLPEGPGELRHDIDLGAPRER